MSENSSTLPADHSSTAAAVAPPPSPQLVRRATLAVGLGAIIENYDFSVYAFLAVTLGPLFFPSDVPGVSMLVALAVFGTSYVFRPLGGWFFGVLGDRRGRKPALVTSILLMGAGCALFGLLPTYAAVGVAAPVLLVVLRLLQGFSVGGEISGSATYIAEFAPRGRRGLFGSSLPMGSTLGWACAATVIGLLTTLLSKEQMASWGWRVPFLLSIPLVLVCLWARSRLEDTPDFIDYKSRPRAPRSPLVQVLLERPGSVLKVVGLTVAMTGAGYISLSYFSTFLIATVGLDAKAVYWTSAISIALAAFTFPLSGRLTDRIGRRPALLAAFGLYLVIAWPGFAVLNTAGSLIVIGLVYVVFIAISGIAQSAAFPQFAELFPLRMRYTGVSLGYNVGAILAGGMAPYAASQLAFSTGDPMAPAFWVMAVAVVGLITLATLRETGRSDLPT